MRLPTVSARPIIIRSRIHICVTGFCKTGQHATSSDLVQVCDQLGVRQLIAVIGDSDNHASINLHAKCGSIRSGFCHRQAINMAAGSTLC